ncbi:hypothetical protein BGZ76_000404 [Entomortierella beljakovae]|nr:hypothetical protein BGZ76_000404 [Entomortierella beljakovae]
MTYSILLRQILPFSNPLPVARRLLPSRNARYIAQRTLTIAKSNTSNVYPISRRDDTVKGLLEDRGMESSSPRHRIQAQELLSEILEREVRIASKQKEDLANAAPTLKEDNGSESTSSSSSLDTNKQDPMQTLRLGKSFRIGLSGPPGVGKSTFIEAFGMYLLSKGHRVSVLAVDPSSARTGGSILGDKTRMTELSRSEEAYVRPTPSRGTLAAGYDICLVETVGVGQSETVVADIVDMQGMKKGIMELSDLVIVNKSDGALVDSARNAQIEYTSALKFVKSVSNNWNPKVIRVSSMGGPEGGIEEAWNTMREYFDIMESSGELSEKRGNQRKIWMWRQVSSELLDLLNEDDHIRGMAKELEGKVLRNEVMSGDAAHKIVERFMSDTEYGRHAVDIAHNLDLQELDTLVVVSGDGVLHEVINGLLTRPDWDKARKLPIGIVPAGSGNAIATSIGTRNTIVSTLALIRGQTAKLDIYSLSQFDRPRIYSMLMFSWGMMADADIESERYRWLGALRFDIAGLVRMIKLRRYAGKIYALPPKHKPAGQATSQDSSKQDSPPTHYTSLLTNTKEEPPSPWRLLPNMPFFSMFALLNFPAAGETILFSNAIRMNDGVMRLFYSCETSIRKIFFPFVLDTTNGKLLDRGLLQDEEGGGLLIIPGVEGKPDDPSTHEIVRHELVTSESAKRLDIYKKPGVFDVDGEVMPTSRTLIEILPRFMNLIVPEWHYHYKDIDEEEDEDDRKEKKEEGKGRREKAILGKVKESLILETVMKRRTATGQGQQGILLAVVAIVIAVAAVAATNTEILDQSLRALTSLTSSI